MLGTRDEYFSRRNCSRESKVGLSLHVTLLEPTRESRKTRKSHSISLIPAERVVDTRMTGRLSIEGVDRRSSISIHCIPRLWLEN
jgi:hypothetical protein